MLSTFSQRFSPLHSRVINEFATSSRMANPSFAPETIENSAQFRKSECVFVTREHPSQKVLRQRLTARACSSRS
jgi:hypothetical protein